MSLLQREKSRGRVAGVGQEARRKQQRADGQGPADLAFPARSNESPRVLAKVQLQHAQRRDSTAGHGDDSPTQRVVQGVRRHD